MLPTGSLLKGLELLYLMMILSYHYHTASTFLVQLFHRGRLSDLKWNKQTGMVAETWVRHTSVTWLSN